MSHKTVQRVNLAEANKTNATSTPIAQPNNDEKKKMMLSAEIQGRLNGQIAYAAPSNSQGNQGSPVGTGFNA